MAISIKQKPYPYLPIRQIFKKCYLSGFFGGFTAFLFEIQYNQNS